MSNTFKGYTTHVQREIDARIERQEINDIVNTSFEPIERKVFYSSLYFVLATLILLPTVLHLI